MSGPIRSLVGAIIFNFPKLTFVTGGASSGKSRFAEGLVSLSDLPRTYIATAQAFDGEMQQKIEQHQKDRGTGWTTVEAPLALPEAIASASAGQVVLVDCLTMWLSNLLLQGQDIKIAKTAFLDATQASAAPIVTVSNEVGAGIVPENRLARDFRNWQGRLNQAVAAQADLAVLVVAGLPLALKGQLP